MTNYQPLKSASLAVQLAAGGKVRCPRAAQPWRLKAILDTNIYDRLDGDSAARALVRHLVDARKLTVVVTRTIYEGNTVGRCGIMCAGDSAVVLRVLPALRALPTPRVQPANPLAEAEGTTLRRSSKGEGAHRL